MHELSKENLSEAESFTKLLLETPGLSVDQSHSSILISDFIKKGMNTDFLANINLALVIEEPIAFFSQLIELNIPHLAEKVFEQNFDLFYSDELFIKKIKSRMYDAAARGNYKLVIYINNCITKKRGTPLLTNTEKDTTVSTIASYISSARVIGSIETLIHDNPDIWVPAFIRLAKRRIHADSNAIEVASDSPVHLIQLQEKESLAFLLNGLNDVSSHYRGVFYRYDHYYLKTLLALYPKDKLQERLLYEVITPCGKHTKSAIACLLSTKWAPYELLDVVSSQEKKDMIMRVFVELA
jgi:hypothetical protein